MKKDTDRTQGQSILKRVNDYFAPAHFDELPPLVETTRLILAILFVTSLLLVADDWFNGEGANAGVYLLLTCITSAALALTFRGHFLLPRLATPFIVLWIVTYIIFKNDMGLHDYAMQSYPAVVILSGLLLGKRAPLLFSGLCVLMVFGLCHSEITGFMPSKLQEFADYRDLLTISLILVATGTIMQVLMNALTSSVERTRRNERALREANRQLQEHARRLEAQELALQESNERYRSLFNSNVIGIYVHDLGGQFLDASDIALKWLGYTREQIRSLNIADLLGNETQIQAAWTAIEELLRTGHETIPREFQVACRDGRLLWLEIEGALLYKEGAAYAIHGIFRDITERKRTREKIFAALQEKEILLREIHHRVKNNMQVISSLLNLQSDRLPDPLSKRLFRESRQRIRSMALIHEKLYQSEDLSSVDFGEYITLLVHELHISYETPLEQIEISVDMAKVVFGLDLAIPCGLIIHELVSNALKYAYSHGKGTLAITLAASDENRYALKILDDGIGMPENFDIAQTKTLGIQLVKGLVEEQLDGTLELHSRQGEGTQWIIMFS